MDVLGKKSAPRRKMPPPAHEPVSQADAVEADDGMDGDLDGDADEDDDDVHSSRQGGAPAEPAVPVEQVQFADVVSGRFDADEVDDQLLPLKRVLAPQPEFPKLHKILAQAFRETHLVWARIGCDPGYVGQLRDDVVGWRTAERFVARGLLPRVDVGARAA